MTKQELELLIGEECFLRLDKVAGEEVALALKMSLIDEYQKENFYHQRNLITELLVDSDHFQNLDLNISPIDVVNIFFRCKLFFAVKDHKEYIQRVGGGSFSDPMDFVVEENERTKGIDMLVDQYLELLISTINERTLLTELSHFHSGGMTPAKEVEDFFISISTKLGFDFSCFIDDKALKRKHKLEEPHLIKYTQKDAKRYFSAPSLGFKAIGSPTYLYLYCGAWLRTFLNLLRIGSFIYPAQVDFGYTNTEVLAPTSPVFLSKHSSGCYCWDEDKKEPWKKIPDGCLFLSFGYRGFSKMWLDSRTFPSLEKFFIDNKIILSSQKNPWGPQNINDILPTIDILSTATQIPDLGAKILLIYCCLEHLFVPKGSKAENKKYIVGGIHALQPELLDWFNELYQTRNKYAHKGYVLRSDKLRGFVSTSMKNVIKLLILKLNLSKV